MLELPKALAIAFTATCKVELAGKVKVELDCVNTPLVMAIPFMVELRYKVKFVSLVIKELLKTEMLTLYGTVPELFKDKT